MLTLISNFYKKNLNPLKPGNLFPETLKIQILTNLDLKNQDFDKKNKNLENF